MFVQYIYLNESSNTFFPRYSHNVLVSDAHDKRGKRSAAFRISALCH